MRTTLARPAVAVALVALLVGCGATGTQAPAPTPASTAAPQPGTGQSPEDQVCGRSTELVQNVRNSAHILDIGPVLPAAIALLFLASRGMAQQQGVTDPALVGALNELVAAIDDLDAQSRAARPTASNPAEGPPVKFDTKRVSAAADGLAKACAARG